MFVFKSAGELDAGFLRRRALPGLDSHLPRFRFKPCVYGAFESNFCIISWQKLLSTDGFVNAMGISACGETKRGGAFAAPPLCDSARGLG